MGAAVATKKGSQAANEEQLSQLYSSQVASPRRAASLSLSSLSSQSSGEPDSESEEDGEEATGSSGLVLKCIESLRVGLGLSFQWDEELMDSVEEISVEPGEIVLRRGDKAVGIYVVQEGWLEVLSPREDTVLCRLGRKDFCGELSSFFHTSCTATVRSPPDAAVKLATCTCTCTLVSLNLS